MVVDISVHLAKQIFKKNNDDYIISNFLKSLINSEKIFPHLQRKVKHEFRKRFGSIYVVLFVPGLPCVTFSANNFVPGRCIWLQGSKFLGLVPEYPAKIAVESIILKISWKLFFLKESVFLNMNLNDLDTFRELINNFVAIRTYILCSINLFGSISW